MELYANGVRITVKLGDTPEQLRADRIRADRLFPLAMFERNCRMVWVAGRDIAAWRIVGTVEMLEHECLVEHAGERFSHCVF
jgi:hypothetical protein